MNSLESEKKVEQKKNRSKEKKNTNYDRLINPFSHTFRNRVFGFSFNIQL